MRRAVGGVSRRDRGRGADGGRRRETLARVVRCRRVAKVLSQAGGCRDEREASQALHSFLPSGNRSGVRGMAQKESTSIEAVAERAVQGVPLKRANEPEDNAAMVSFLALPGAHRCALAIFRARVP
jgi:hypothetical protein